MEYVARRSRQYVSKTDILAINNEANKDRQRGNKVINASIGTFLDNNKNIGGIQLINQALKEHITDDLGYTTVYGNSDYLDSVMFYVFSERLDKIRELYQPFIGATLGGTGAISISFNLFLEEGDNVLLPEIMWSNYKLVALKAHVGYETYKVFDDDGNFNLASLREMIQKQMEKQERTLVVINDPCHNPTGYCLSEEEYEKLFAMLDEEGKKGYLSVLFDIAYISFFHIPRKKCNLIDMLARKTWNFLPLIAFSCSKLFSLYGSRVGALIALPNDEENKNEIKRAFGAQARGTYSTPNGTTQHAISVVMKDENKMVELHRQIQENCDMLAKRSEILLKELEENNIPHYTYKSGFFVTLIVDDAKLIAEKLKVKHMYVVPMDEHSLRIAISGLTETEISELIKTLKTML